MIDLPPAAACRHLDAREGFEVLFPRREEDGYRLDGHSSGVEAGGMWALRYPLVLDRDWLTREARVAGRSVDGEHEVLLEADGAGAWRVDGRLAPELDGCLEVDLEASGFTNAVPVRRLGLAIGEGAEAPAAYLRAPDLRVERLEQSYARLPDDGKRSRYEYAAPAFDFSCVIVYDEHGLVLDYPGIAARVA